MNSFQRGAALCVLALLFTAGVCAGAEPSPIASNALGGTLARDHQSRAIYFAGEHRRTYLAYMDHDFDARVVYYDHDAKAWCEPMRVDTCVAEVGWCKGIKDGHNAPNIWVSKSGIVHLVYGSHGTPFKYARSKKPESIEDWELGERLSDFATYPYFCQLPDGELLLFFRYGPTGGYKNPFLGLQRTKDEGSTWTPVAKLGAFSKACKLNGRNAVYDPVSQRIHLNLAVIIGKSWKSFACQYDPAGNQMYSWDGETALGAMPGDDEMVEHCAVDGLTLQELFVRGGVQYMLLERGGGYSFAAWDGKALVRNDIPEDKTKGFKHGPMWTTDGKHVRIFGTRDTDPPTEFSGGDLYVLTSTDGGAAWDDGKCLMDRRALGYGLQGVNLTTDYPGHGPFLIVAEATGKLPEDFKDTPRTHYDNPWRRNKRLFALDEHGKLMPGRE